jgi:uncharacterized protein
MDLEWDEDKRRKALAERGIDFADVVDFDFETARTAEDIRFEYGEPRYVSTGYLQHRLCVLCWTWRNDRLRVISLRKANDRETKAYRESFDE